MTFQKVIKRRLDSTRWFVRAKEQKRLNERKLGTNTTKICYKAIKYGAARRHWNDILAIGNNTGICKRAIADIVLYRDQIKRLKLQ